MCYLYTKGLYIVFVVGAKTAESIGKWHRSPSQWHTTVVKRNRRNVVPVGLCEFYSFMSNVLLL